MNAKQWYQRRVAITAGDGILRRIIMLITYYVFTNYFLYLLLMFHNLKRRCSDSPENRGKRKYNTRSKDKRHDDVPTLSQSAKGKLDLLAQLRSKKINKNESDENKNKLFNKWSLLSSDEEIDKVEVNKSNNFLNDENDANDRSRSASLSQSFASSESSDDYSSSASSCSYGKSKKFRKAKKNNRKASDSDCAKSERSNDEKLTRNIKKHIKGSKLKDNSEDDNDDTKYSSNENLSTINSELSEENSEKDFSNDEQGLQNLTKIKRKHKHKKSSNGDSFVLQASSQVNSYRKDSTSDENRVHKNDSVELLAKKDRHKSKDQLGPMHFTTHETVNADPNLVSNLSHDVFKKCKDLMKEVKDDIKAVSKLKKEKEVVHRISKHLLNIGKHINHVLIKYKDPEQIKEWRGNLWSYVSHYSYYNSFRLLKIYKNLLRIQETENDKRNHEITDACENDYYGWNYKK